jgi:hypothetical protein
MEPSFPSRPSRLGRSGPVNDGGSADLLSLNACRIKLAGIAAIEKRIFHIKDRGSVGCIARLRHAFFLGQTFQPVIPETLSQVIS